MRSTVALAVFARVLPYFVLGDGAHEASEEGLRLVGVLSRAVVLSGDEGERTIMEHVYRPYLRRVIYTACEARPIPALTSVLSSIPEAKVEGTGELDGRGLAFPWTREEVGFTRVDL